MSSALARALSPALGANTDATIQGLSAVVAALPHPDKEAEAARLKEVAANTAAVARHSVFSGCASIQEVSNCIATPYRKAVTDHLLALERNLEKLASVRGSLTKLSSHEARGTLPQQLRINIPGPQLTRVFADSEKGRAHIAAYEEELAALRLALLKKQIAAKKDEVLSLEAGVHARTVVESCRRDIDAISTEVFRSHRVIQIGRAHV